jgi:hypothetical protein
LLKNENGNALWRNSTETEQSALRSVWNEMALLDAPMADFRSPGSANCFFEKGVKKGNCEGRMLDHGGHLRRLLLSANADGNSIGEQKAKCQAVESARLEILRGSSYEAI